MYSDKIREWQRRKADAFNEESVDEEHLKKVHYYKLYIYGVKVKVGEERKRTNHDIE